MNFDYYASLSDYLNNYNTLLSNPDKHEYVTLYYHQDNIAILHIQNPYYENFEPNILDNHAHIFYKDECKLKDAQYTKVETAHYYRNRIGLNPKRKFLFTLKYDISLPVTVHGIDKHKAKKISRTFYDRLTDTVNFI